MKLRYWPDCKDDDGQVLDIDWSYIKALPGQRVGELRIDDEIGGQRNIRVIFYVGRKREPDEMPVVWILLAMVKKRNDFTGADLTMFKVRRRIVIERFYEGQDK